MEGIKKNNNRTKEQYLREADELHQRFTQNLVVKRIDVASVSTTAKMPFKALLLRESLFYRMTELSGVAIDLYRQDKMTSAVIITRALFETMALCYYVYKHLKEVAETSVVEKIDDILMRAGHGGKLDLATFKAFNTLTTIQQLDKEHEGVESLFSFLCEIAHPNWMGCEGAYSKINHEEHYVEFSQTYEHVPPNTGLPQLLMALTLFEYYYNEMGNLLPTFIKISEEDIAKRDERT